MCRVLYMRLLGVLLALVPACLSFAFVSIMQSETQEARDGSYYFRPEFAQYLVIACIVILWLVVIPMYWYWRKSIPAAVNTSAGATGWRHKR